MYREWTPPSPRCPRCHKRLREGVFEQAPFHDCSCGGVFVTQEAFARMWSALAAKTRTFGPIPPRLPRPSIYSLPCPLCARPMARIDLLGVPVDECADDGLWFDFPELDTVLTAAAMPFHDWLRRFAIRIRDMK
jgi:Zn-finger nucleic acid-binding protein